MQIVRNPGKPFVQLEYASVLRNLLYPTNCSRSNITFVVCELRDTQVILEQRTERKLSKFLNIQRGLLNYDNFMIAFLQC